MATAAITPLDLRLGNMPRLCVKTGVETEFVTRQTVSVYPAWTWGLYLFGILPGVIAQIMTKRRLHMILHVTPYAYERALFLSRARAAGMIAIAVLVAVAVSTFAEVAVIAAVIVIIVTAVALLRYGQQVWISPRLDGDWIWLDNVHPDFAHALGRQYSSLPVEARPR